MSKKLVQLIFGISCIYDSLLGVLFLTVPMYIFDYFDVTPPNHLGYIKFPALLLILFGIMFFNISINPIKNLSLIPYGILLKLSYCGIVFYYWIMSDIPGMWKPFAIIDLLFALLFYLSYDWIKKRAN